MSRRDQAATGSQPNSTSFSRCRAALSLAIALVLLLAGIPALAGCSKPQTDLYGYQRSEQVTEYVAIVTNSGKSAIIIQLLPEYAPKTVANFQKLVGEKFYNGLTFHRVIPEFVIQGGDPSGDGTGGPGYTIQGEFSKNGISNKLKHTRGIVSMARQSDNKDSAGSQFFICLADLPDLNGDYATFGKVLEGMAIVDAIAAVPVVNTASNKPKSRQVMEEAFFVTPPAG
jgi:peptidyl-prolyl cis-trans isomerase B (cyclophilin B)